MVKQLDNFHAMFFHGPKKENRFAHFSSFYFELVDDTKKEITKDEIEKHDVLWLTKKEMEEFDLPLGHRHVWNQLQNLESVNTSEGVMVNSGKYNDMSSSDMREKIVVDLEKQGVAKERINNKLRDWIFSRQHYWGEPIPIIHCEKDGAVPVPGDQLPVVLPDVDHYEPTDNGESPLAAIKEWVNVNCPVCDGPAKRETDTMPNWAGSSWYYLRYYDAHNDKVFADRKKLDYWGEVDMYLGGMEHTTLHLLYSRFWHQFFYDQGLVPTPEPYAARRGQGIILATDGSKMSKSKGNVINPNEILEAGYGADALRLAIAFLAPYDQTTPWSSEGVAGTFRFVQRFWTLVQEFLDSKDTPKTQHAVLPIVHKAIKKVSSDLHEMAFNTAIAALMECVNNLYKIKAETGFSDQGAWRFALKSITQLLAPFAPHVCEEIWKELGETASVHVSDWPVFDESYLKTDSVTIVVQINGKVRANIDMPQDSDEKFVINAAKENEKVASYLTDQSIKKTIYVKNRLLNIVVG
jgi:leucyl-tRNA synthetase